MFSATINSYFSWCVSLMYEIAGFMEISYEDFSILVFVVIHPLISVALLFWVVGLRRRLKYGKAAKKRNTEVIRLDPPAIQIP